MIKQFLPDLVTAISDTVQPVSDQCLAKGLIPESDYKRVLESRWTSEDKARTLIQAVKTSTETDSRCLEMFLSILYKQPTCKKLVSTVREELTNIAISMGPSIQPFQGTFEPHHQLIVASSISADEPQHSSKIEEFSLQFQKEEKIDISKAVVPLSQDVQPIPSEELPREYISLQSSLLGKRKGSTHEHEHKSKKQKI